MKFRVNYLATDGAIRYTLVEAETEEQAKEIALDEDAQVNACGDNILKIISVD